MKKALLVDDDYLVRSYLKMLPSWEKAGFCIQEDVRDGEEALEVLEKEEIDLVVTDIAMPLMDGIELIQEVRKKYEYIHIIVLSCHDDFEYVKKAMQEGADEYVLKNTLDEESLYTVLSTAMKHIQKNTEENKFPKLKKNGIEKKAVDEKYMFFNQVLSGMLKGEEREQERLRLDIRGTYQNSAVVVMKMETEETLEDPWEEIETERYCREFLERLDDGLKDLLPGQENENEVVYLGNGVFCCFIDLSGVYKSSVMHQTVTGTAGMCYKICQKERKDYAIGVSSPCIGSEALRQAYQQARLMVKNCFYEQGGIAYYENGKCVGRKFPEESEEMLQRIDTFKYHHDREGFQKCGDKVIKAFKRELTESKLVFQWFRRLAQICGIEEDEKYTGIHRIEGISEALSEIADRFFEGARISVLDNVSNPVRIAGEYAANHFREPIGLSDVAAAAGVNSTYLSYLFSQEMGIGFANYLLNLRIEYAKKLLEESNLKMREVAEKSGFNDYHYFSKVFKKMNGISPAEYRKGQKKML